MCFFSYDNKNEKNIIQDFDFIFNSGDRVSIVGPSGVGKSTLLDLIIGLRSPTKGSIEYIFDSSKNYQSLPKRKIKSFLFLMYPNQIL